jgi:hypothetical protein
LEPTLAFRDTASFFGNTTPTTILEPPRILITEPTIKKCEHSVYNPTGDGHSCQWCNPFLTLRYLAPEEMERAKQFHIQGRGGRRIAHDDSSVPYANGGATRGECPKCGDFAHFDDGKNWECANCGDVRKKPKGFAKHRAVASIRRIG